MPAHDDNTPRETAVNDPKWEVALRAGQQAEGHAGSVEDELAIVNLLRHARAPQMPSEAALDSVWSDLDAELDEQRAATGWRSWLRRPWLLGGSAALAAAAAAVLVVVVSGPDPGPGPRGGGAMAQGDGAQVSDPGVMAATIEAQFAMLEPGARAAVERSVEGERNSLRGQLVASAIAADGRTMGGAP
ncbi:MAG: hypothetical protein K0V04_23010 [Deltaproteobacteria bacterium]|nr:hypothetical protein [Deltaproteobacteria bacterium]